MNQERMGQMRLQIELRKLKQDNSIVSKYVRDIIVDDEKDIYKCQFTLLPPNEPYNVASFVVEMNFPSAYPFKPPTLKFITPIYHLNVDTNGDVYLPLICDDEWLCGNSIEKVIQSFLVILDSPDPHVLRADLVEEFNGNRQIFNHTAEEHARTYAEQR